MKLDTYEPQRDYKLVCDLWERTLGRNYGVTDRVMRPRIWTRPSLESGDGVVATFQGEFAGFGIAEIGRDGLVPPVNGSIEAIVVDPIYQRRGIGSAILARLEKRIQDSSCKAINVASGLQRFWSGVPEDLPTALSFFRSRGYSDNYEAIDLVAELSGFAMKEEYMQRLQAEGAIVESLKADGVGRLYDLLTREAIGWRESMVRMVSMGDIANVLVVKYGEELIGCIQTCTPSSRFRCANLVWERKYGPLLGGFGAVLIAKEWRKKKLGVCMIQAATQHVKDFGATHCFIDWTSRELAHFYGKMGAEICGVYRKFSKSIV